MSIPNAPARDALRRRLAAELDDRALAADLARSLDDAVVERLAGHDIATTPLLSYRPATVPAAAVDTLWILAFGYRITGTSRPVGPGDPVPAMGELEPGPVNEELARIAAAFVAEHPMPIVAQWEVADVLGSLDVAEVVAVEPDLGEDGSVVYLSTAGVLEKGKRLAEEAGMTVGRAGVLAHHDHVNRCLLTAAVAGMLAAVPEDVDLPTAYDTESGQVWTRSRTVFLPLDLMARAHL